MSNDFLKQAHDDLNKKRQRRYVILIDMDNTIVDYSSQIAPVLQTIYKDIQVTKDNWQTLKLNDLHFHRKNIQSQPGFFRSMKPIDGALDALKEMDMMGHDVFIVSSPSTSGDTCHSEKSEWVKEHLGEKWARRLILTKDKTVVIGDILIDDKPNIHGLVTSTWQHILFAQPYNIHLEKEGRIILHNWNNWTDIVDTCLESNTAIVHDLQ